MYVHMLDFYMILQCLSSLSLISFNDSSIYSSIHQNVGYPMPPCHLDHHLMAWAACVTSLMAWAACVTSQAIED